MTSSSVNVETCMLMVWVFELPSRVKGVHHTTVITWVKRVGEFLPDAYERETIPEVGELDE